MNNNILIIAPHPDDETLACGGTIMKRLKEGWEVVVVFMTDGRHALSNKGILSNPTPEELQKIRRVEAVTAAKILGVPEKNLIFWDFEDLSLSKNYEAVRSKTSKVLYDIQPVEIYFPSDKDLNKDHQTANEILEECVEGLKFKATAYQYFLFPKFVRLRPFFNWLTKRYKHNLRAIDISEFVAQKAAALDAYTSQTKIIAEKQVRPDLINLQRFLKKHEVFFVRE